jgi:hypothetical protein
VASPYSINANLNFGSMCAGMAFTNPLQAYTQAYNNYLSANQTNYNNIVAGYNKLACTLQGALAPIAQGYTNLSNQVLGTIQGTEQSQLQSVQCTYTKQSGMAQQQAINSGLGNSTVLSSLNRGIAACEARAQTAVTNQYAQTVAGYEANLGLAGLNFQNQAAMEQAGLGTQALGFLAGIQIPPPCMSGYSQLYQGQLARLAGVNNGPGPTPTNPKGVATPARGNYSFCQYGSPYAGGTSGGNCGQQSGGSPLGAVNAASSAVACIGSGVLSGLKSWWNSAPSSITGPEGETMPYYPNAPTQTSYGGGGYGAMAYGGGGFGGCGCGYA